MEEFTVWLQFQLDHLPVDANGFICLPIGGRQLAPYCHNVLQQALLDLSRQDVLIMLSSMIIQQISTHRLSYINLTAS
jgi:hypothetical protein